MEIVFLSMSTGLCAGVTLMNFLQNGWSRPAVFGAFVGITS